MQNFLQVNRALAAEKNLNYFNLNQIKSNPDGGQTCDGNRQSRLMSYRCYLRNLAMIFAILTLSIANIGMAWGAASTSSDEKYASGTITFADFGNIAAETNYWYNGIKVYSGGVQSAKASNSTWSEKVSVPAYISDKTAGKEANKGKWGSNGSGKQYTMSGLAFNTHAIGIHVNGKCTVTVVVDKNIGSDTDDAGITASVDATAYGTAWTKDTYKTVGTPLEVTSTRADKTNYPGRYTLTIPITTDGEKVVKMFNSSSGTGAGKLFCFESITVTPASSGYKLSVFNSSTNGEYNFVAGTGENEIVINDFVIPKYTAEGDLKQFWVGPGSYTGKATNEYFSWKRAYHQQNNSCTSNLTLGSPVNAIGTLHAWTNSDQPNYGLCFEPNGYGIVWGVNGSPWTNVPFKSTGEPTVWLTDIVSLTSDMISTYKYYVGLLTNDGGYVGSFREEGNACGLSKTDNISGMQRKTASGDNWADGLVAGHGKFRIWVNNCAQNFYCHFVPHYKLTYNANGGEGAPEAAYVSVEETPCQWSLDPKQPTRTDYNFLGWSTNSSATKADADAEVADLGKPYGANGDVTLYAVWQACSGPNAGSSTWTAAGYTYDQNATANEMSLTGVTASNGGDLSYQWYKTTSDVANGEAISGATSNTYRPATDVAHADNWFYFCRVTEAGCSTTYTTPLSGAIVVNAASLTALECNTLYKVEHMVPASITLTSEGQYGAGLSANTKFEVIGDPAAAGDAGGTPEMKNEAASFAEQSFTARMYLKGASNTTGSGTTFVPTSRAVKFIVSESGTLDIYAHRVDRLYLKKVGDSGTTQLGTSTSGSGSMVSHNVTAGTYYIYATNSSTCVYGVRLNCCSTPAAPTAFAAGSITSTGATFTITDAANATSYDIYYSTSNSAPDAGTAATTTSTKKTKAVTGLTASTTYYAWVRSVCDADHKSAWVALTSPTAKFTTSAPEAEALVHWTMNVETDGAWGTTATSTTDGTNISSISTSHDEGDNIGKNSATAKTAMAEAEVTTAAEPTKSAKFTFTVKATKKVVPEKVTCEVYNVSAGNRTYKAQISDSNGHVYNSTNTVAVSKEATLTPATFTFASGLVLTGNVTVKVYAWKTSGSPTDFRMGQHVKLFGEVDDYNCTALNLTRGGQESGTYTVGNYTGNPLTCTVNAGEPASYQWKQYTLGQGEGQAVNAVGSGSTTTSFTPNPASANTYFYACEVTDICGNTSRTPYTGTFVFNAAPTYSVTHSLTNVTATSGATGAGAATEGVAYDAVFAANSGYVLPSTITVTIGGSLATVGTGYTWNASTGAFQVPAAQVTGDIVVTIAGETAPATKDIYYGAITITAGALTKGSTGTSQFFTNIGGTIENNTEISWSSGPGTGGQYYESNVLTDAELSQSSNWSTGSSSNKYIQGFKFKSGSTYTLALGSKVASSITFYGRNGSASKTMTVGGQGWTSSSTKETFAKHEFTKSGGFTGNVSITETGDFYGILVITIQTAAPCTTPVIPELSNQSLCVGADIVEWDATQTAVLKDGETVAYSWKKKGNDTELANTATYDLGSSATEAMAGTYVVTATVSKAGYASSMATKEVTLTVNEATEVTAIKADKATVYPTNSVTLTATANVTPQSWQWYTCTNAEGAGEAIINDATSASYTITPASAGTYYYKVKATGSCGTAERVYTLVVSPAAGGDCFHYVSVLPDKDISPSSGASIVTPTHATTLEGGTMKVGSSQVTITKNGLKLESSKYVSITLDAALEAGNVVIVKGSTAKAGNGVTINGVNFYESGSKTFDVSYTVTADDGLVGKTALTVTKYSGSSYLQEIKITGCGEACTDPEVTASVDNSTACVGTSVTFTATGAHAEATYQWQKYSGGAWTNIADATAATYNIPSVATTDALKYRVIATNTCGRTSNEVTLSVPVAPVFNSFTATRTVMATLALSITDVEASDATSYAWYKSADATYDAGTDTKVGTSKDLLLASGGEAAGDTYYLFCVASNACGTTTSGAITVNVTAYVEEDCATKGNEGVADFGFVNTGCSEATYSETACWKSGGRAYYLTYSAPTGKYLEVAKVTVAISKNSKCGYAYSTDNGTNWTYAELTDLSTTLTEKTINLSGKNVTDFRIGRNLQDGSSKDWGSTSGTFYLSKICFEYSNACTATTVTPSTSSVNYTMGGDWTNPKFTLSVAGTLTYSSSNEEIASVDENGKVTFNDKAGTVTITAAYAGNATYCASEGSYTITVSCSGGAPKIVAADGTNMSDCNSSITLNAKQQDGKTDFTDGSYQWFRNGEEIEGATSKSYTAIQTGVYTVEYTSAGGCTSPSTNNATVTSDNVEPEVERLVPFQYYHVNKTYSDQMKDRHLFSVKGSAEYDSTGKNFKLTMSRSGGEAVDITTAASIFVTKSGDGQVDTVMIDLNKLSGKYSEGDELVLTCAAIDCNGNASDVYKNTITIHAIGATPTLALICSGTDIAAGTRNTKKLTVGGDFLTGYNVADLCQQTGDSTFDANTEWGLYTRLKENYIVTPVNGYAVFNKLNYEPFDILLLTDYPKASKSPAAATVLDDMADLCDYRPMLSFKAHMVAKSPSKWAAKGFTTAPVAVKQGDGRTHLNIVCYAHPMFDGIKDADEHIFKDNDATGQIVYEMLTGTGYESSKGIQGFEIAAAENFVTIGMIHYNASVLENNPSTGMATWTGGTDKKGKPNDRILVAAVERQANPEARMVMLAVNCGAQSKFTETGRTIVHKCLQYLLSDYTITPMADCSFTFDNGAGALHDPAWYKDEKNCPGCTGTLGDGKWSTAANWAPDRLTPPGKDTEVKIAAPVEVDMTHAIARSARIVEGGHITIPAGKALEIVGTIRRLDGTEISPTENSDITIGSSDAGNGSLIFNNDKGDSKARVLMYSNAPADVANMSAATSTWQYIGTPHTDVTNARSNYYGSWLYQYSGSGWDVIPNGGPLVPFHGYCITNETAPIVYDMEGTLVATTTQDIAIPAGYTVIANSWTAPIDISTFTDDDMENISDKTIYFFNTGTDVDGNHGTGTEPGTYVAVPKNSASYIGTWQIPSMQGFYISTTTAGTLHLDYDRHVRPTGGRTIVGNPMYAPRRAKAAEEEPAVLKIFARGSRYQDKLVVLEREDFTRGYDSGWDGEAWGGGTLSPMVYVTGEGREDAVSAIPEFEGTVVAFKAGEDSEYRFEFIYSEDAEQLYLFDTENNTYTQIMTGNAYYFTTSDKAPHSRFILTRKAPQITTGTELTSDGESAKARKLLIEDKMYILLNGMLYDATGKVVK